MVACLNSSEAATAGFEKNEMWEKLFTFLVAFFAAVTNYFHCHCVLFSPIHTRPSDCYLNIHGFMAFHSVQFDRLFGRCFLLLFFSPHEISSFLLYATFYSYHATFFSLFSGHRVTIGWGFSFASSRLLFIAWWILMRCFLLLAIDSGILFQSYVVIRWLFRWFLYVYHCHN